MWPQQACQTLPPRDIPQQPSSQVVAGEELGADSIKDDARIAPAQATPQPPVLRPSTRAATVQIANPVTLTLTQALTLILAPTLTLTINLALAPNPSPSPTLIPTLNLTLLSCALSPRPALCPYRP